jgi:hypothetical protein
MQRSLVGSEMCLRDRALRSRWFGANGGLERPKVDVVLHRSDRGCYCEAWDGRWNVGPEKADRLHALHMIAHFCAPQDKALHGPEFAHVFVRAVGRFMGKDAEKALRDAFRDHRVKLYTWSAKAKKQASERSVDRKFRSSGERLRELVASLERDDW